MAKPELTKNEEQYLKQGAYLMLKSANLTDPFDN